MKVASKPKKHGTTVPMGTGHNKFTGKKRLQAMAFFKSCPWSEWWQEFWTARDKVGRLAYLTPYQFARAKTKSRFELDIVYRAIGEKPIDLPKFKDSIYREVLYLGNWQEMRKKAYFFEPSGEHYEEAKRALLEKQHCLEVLRSTSKVWLERVRKKLKFEEDIIEAFGGSPVDVGSTYAQLDKKSKVFYTILERNNTAIERDWNLFLISIGITPTDAAQPGTTNLIVAGANSQVLNAAAPVANDPRSLALKGISEIIYDKAQIFGMPVPAPVAPHRQDEEDVEEQAPQTPMKVVR